MQTSYPIPDTIVDEAEMSKLILWFAYKDSHIFLALYHISDKHTIFGT